MWQMRNEELETRMITEGQKMWSMKQICQEQQKQLKRQTVERQSLVNQMGSYKQILQENTINCKQAYYDIYATLVETHGIQEIHENLVSTKQKNTESDLDREKLLKEVESHIEFAKH